jgi:anti-anti-sigma factor
MTSPLNLDWTMSDGSTARLTVEGELNFETAAPLLDAVEQRLAEHPELRELRLDCAKLGHCDSYGLSMLLMVHRRTQRAGVALRLDNRTGTLDRMLELTGTVEHLTAGAAVDDHSQSS